MGKWYAYFQDRLHFSLPSPHPSSRIQTLIVLQSGLRKDALRKYSTLDSNLDSTFQLIFKRKDLPLDFHLRAA